MRFDLIRNIEISDSKSWEGKYFLTFDIDWAHDDVIEDCIDLVGKFDLPATWFITHESPVLELLRNNPLNELGIHPDFNPLLKLSNDIDSDYSEIVEKIMKIVPDATSCRSHSVVGGGLIGHALKTNGITHESNINIPEESDMQIRPFRGNNGMTNVPYCWADEHAFLGRQSDDFIDIGRRHNLVIFDFHPIHVFLNSESVSRYEDTRLLHKNPEELIKYRYEGYGTRNRLIDLLKMSEEQ